MQNQDKSANPTCLTHLRALLSRPSVNICSSMAVCLLAKGPKGGRNRSLYGSGKVSSCHETFNEKNATGQRPRERERDQVRDFTKQSLVRKENFLRISVSLINGLGERGGQRDPPKRFIKFLLAVPLTTSFCTFFFYYLIITLYCLISIDSVYRCNN